MKTTTLAVIAIVLMAFLVAPMVSASQDNAGGRVSKYEPTVPDMGTKTGRIAGQLNIGTIGLTSGLMVLGPDGTMYHPALTQYGAFEMNDLSPGEYYIYIADGNGAQPEASKATVRAGYTSTPESMLIGHAVSEPGVKVGKAFPKIDFALYGANGIYIVVTAQVQEAANMGVPFVFNNAMNPGGIVNGAQDTVLVVIADPLYGVVKDVHIWYNGGVIHAAEYETITL